MHQFIQDAIKGGWNPIPNYYMVRAIYERNVLFSGGEGDTECYQIEQMLLEPKAWEAVGKTRGWTGYECGNCGYKHFDSFGFSECCHRWSSAKQIHQWESNMLQFVRYLIGGLSIEEALNKI